MLKVICIKRIRGQRNKVRMYKSHDTAKATIHLDTGKSKIVLEVRRDKGIPFHLNFYCFLPKYFQEVVWENIKIRINGKFLNYLQFANGISIFFCNSPEEIEDMLIYLAEANIKVGL